MSLDLCILASGSGGNCSVIRAPSGAMLIDAGIGPRSTAKRLDGTGTLLQDIRAICLTHLDHDHFRSTWIDTIIKLGFRVFCHEELLESILQYSSDLSEVAFPFDGDPFSPLDELRVHPIRLAHDQRGSHGFLIEGFGCRIGYATDLGRVPARLVEQFCDVDVLAIESNYDSRMQLASARPEFLKRRIMGGRGHLSNEQALDAVKQILARCARPPAHIVLLHRSRQCNCPNLLREIFSRDARIARRLTLGEQFMRTEWLRIRPRGRPHVGEQLTFLTELSSACCAAGAQTA